MREIKFCGKRLDDGKWTHGWLVVELNGTAWISQYYHRGEWEQVDPATVGEFSEWKDCDEADLFEGDIVKGFDALFVIKKGIVKINKVSTDGSTNEVEISCFYFEHEGEPLFPIVNNYKGENDLQTLKKIGNIHDNPELLEAQP
jgi:uncharacterized phage protein (TIGR01671 family)